MGSHVADAVKAYRESRLRTRSTITVNESDVTNVRAAKISVPR